MNNIYIGKNTLKTKFNHQTLQESIDSFLVIANLTSTCQIKSYGKFSKIITIEAGKITLFFKTDHNNFLLSIELIKLHEQSGWFVDKYRATDEKEQIELLQKTIKIFNT